MIVVGARPPRIDIDAFVGSPVDCTIPVLDENDQPVSSLAGWQVRARFTGAGVSAPLTATIETVDGAPVVRIGATQTQTAAWTWVGRAAPWDVALTTPQGDRLPPLCRGWIRLQPAQSPAAPVLPGAPTIGTATLGAAGAGTATVVFTAPASDGGSPITGYTVTSTPGGLTATGATSPITISGLTVGTAYTFTVSATSAVGTGPGSAPSDAVTPLPLPPSEFRLFDGATGPTTTFNDGQPMTAGLEFTVTATNVSAAKIWYYRASTAQGDAGVQGQIYAVPSGTPLLAQPVVFNAPVGLGWKSVTLPTPVALTPGARYKVAVFFADGEYANTGSYWAGSGAGASGLANGPLSAPSNAAALHGQGVFHFGGSTPVHPTESSGAGNYWVDVTVTRPAGS